MTKKNITTPATAADWFSVDRDGLREMYANFPTEKLVTELIQNAFDENSTLCAVEITEAGNATYVTVRDDNPDGFRNIRDAYTLFGTTTKRSDPEKRGRFNLGEKLVLARAKSATITTTTGTITFDGDGRHFSHKGTEAGSIIKLVFTPRWKQKELTTTLEFLTQLYPPKGVQYSVNGENWPYIEAYKETETVLPTETLMPLENGQMAMQRTRRKTRIRFYTKRDRCDAAQLFEMGIPICAIEGNYDIDVQQKIPLDKDRTMVPTSYLQDIYAELMNALVDEIPTDSISSASMRMALEDTRLAPEVAATLFKRSFGDTAVIQSHDADSDQEAVRQGAAMVSSRTFGADVNAKLRLGGIQTAKEAFCRDITIRSANGMGMPGGYREMNEDTPARRQFKAYTQMLASRLYGTPVVVEFAHWQSGNAKAIYQRVAGGSDKVVYNVFKLGNAVLTHPVTQGTALVLHELAHCKGAGHEGVYDHEFERTVNEHTILLAKHPELYEEFEPEAFRSGNH